MVAIYEAAEAAAEAIERLVTAGFDVQSISVVGKEAHAEGHVVGSYRTGDQVTYWGQVGAFWGGAWELLRGSAFLLVPTLGPVLVAGPLVGSILAGLGGGAAARGMSALGAGFYHYGVPKHRARDCEAAVRAGKYVLIAHGTPLETTLAETIVEISNQPDFNPKPSAADSRWLDDGGSVPPLCRRPAEERKHGVR